jgi:hypothetical protein
MSEGSLSRVMSQLRSHHTTRFRVVRGRPSRRWSAAAPTSFREVDGNEIFGVLTREDVLHDLQVFREFAA